MCVGCTDAIASIAAMRRGCAGGRRELRVFDAKPRVPRPVDATRRLRGVERDVHGGRRSMACGDANGGVGGDDPRLNVS